MKRTLATFIVCGLLYTSTGIFIVNGNEQAVVRRFGKLILSSNGSIAVRGSGLHFDWPWPFSEVDRIELGEIRTINFGVSQEIDDNMSEFLRPWDQSVFAPFLTGDKNVLHLQIAVHFRISPVHPEYYLFYSESPQRRLRDVTESSVFNLIAQSGVDYVHPSGLTELQALVTQRTRMLVERFRLGVIVEDVTIVSVTPPIPVKPSFLDVSNARAEKETHIQSALAYADQRVSAARAEAKRRVDAAEILRRHIIENSHSRADTFRKLVRQFQLDEQLGVQDYVTSRRLTLQRLYIETLTDVLSKVAGQVYVDSGPPVDLTIFRKPLNQ